MHDSRIGRFFSVDPLAIKYKSISPFAFVANNPVYYVDTDGREIKLSFASLANAGTFNSVISLLSSTSIFSKVYQSLQADYDVYKIEEIPASEIAAKDQAGLIIYGYYRPFLRPTCLTKDETVIRFNPATGLNKATVFEEFFHAAQDNYYWTYNKTLTETEAKMAQAYTVYSSLSSGDRLSPQKVKEAMTSFGMTKAEQTLLVDASGNLVQSSIDYFNSKINNTDLTESQENAFRTEMKTYAATISNDGYNFDAKELSSYTGECDYFESLVDSPKSDEN